MSVMELILPILLTGLATHFISVLAWMVLPHHKPEWNRLPDEDAFQDWLEDRGVAANQYIFPHAANSEEMKSEAYLSKQTKCRGTLILWERPVNMGANVGLTLAFFAVAAFVIGYVASIGLPRGADFMTVFRFVATVGLLTHCAGQFPGVFWFRRRVAMDLLDGVAHAVATGLIFASMWPN